VPGGKAVVYSLAGTFPSESIFTGQRYDSYIQLTRMGARWYDAALGRWTSADTVVPDRGNPQSFNRYSWVRNNSLRYVDPTGHREEGECPFNDEGCEGQPPDVGEVVVEILQGMVGVVLDPGRTEPIQLTLPDGTLLVIMPMRSESMAKTTPFEQKVGGVLAGVGLGMDILELVSIPIEGASSLPAILDVGSTLAGSLWSGESFVYGQVHPSLPPMAAVGQDVLVNAADLGIAETATWGGTAVAGPAGYIFGRGVDACTTSASLAYDYFRLEGSLQSSSKVGITWDGNFTEVVLIYPGSFPGLSKPGGN
jgi:RHS repeat-associated protein